MTNFFDYFKKEQDKTYNSAEKSFANAGIDNKEITRDIPSGRHGAIPTVINTTQSGHLGVGFGLSAGAAGLGKNTYPLYAMHHLLHTYQWMSQDADVHFAVQEIVNEMTIQNEDNDIISLNLDKLDGPGYSDKVKTAILDEFDNILSMMDWNNTANSQMKNFYINGRAFMKIDVDPKAVEKGATAIKNITPFDVIAWFDDTTKNKFKPKKPDGRNVSFPAGYVITENSYRNANSLGLEGSAYQFGKSTAGERYRNELIAIPKELMVYQHSGVVDQRYNVPLSHLQSALKPLNQLRSLLDSMIIYRLTRAPQKMIFNIPTGRMVPTKAEEYVAKVSNALKKEIKYDPNTGTVSDVNDKMSAYQDLYFAKFQDDAVTVDSIDGGSMVNQLEEVEFMEQKLYKALNIPASRTYSGEGTRVFGASDGEIGYDASRFYKFTNSVQIQFNHFFLELLKFQLSAKKILDTDTFEANRTKFSLIWGGTDLWNDAKKSAILRKKFAMLSEAVDFVGKFGITNEFLGKTIMGFSDEELEAAEKVAIDDLKGDSYKDSIRNGDVRFDDNGDEMVRDPETDQWMTKVEFEKIQKERLKAIEAGEVESTKDDE